MLKNIDMRKILNGLIAVVMCGLYIVIAMFLVIGVISIVGEVVIYFIENPVLGINRQYL